MNVLKVVSQAKSTLANGVKPKIINDVNPRLMNLIKKDNTQKIGNAVMERLPNEYKIFTYPNGKQTVIDDKGNVVLTQITEKGKTYII